MKKIIVCGMLICATFTMLHAQHSESNPFQDYNADQNATTFENAFKHYSAQLAENEDEDNARLMLSYLYLVELERMLEQFKTRVDSLTPKFQFQYANLLLELRKYDESIEIYDILNTNYPNWSCPWRHKGEAYFKSDDLVHAETALQKSIVARIEHYDAYVMLAEVQEAMGKNDEALATLETGFTYKGKDIEDPDEEVDDLDVQFLYLRLLKANDRQNEFEQQKKKLKKVAPSDERWKEIK
ncbi:MAG: hypothetical protein B1H05_04090 [Candidatus Cloacimonas sp. 4484_140]|nr:MAG: hypothetical protein B1H05_04090 [Candidatus Cloacimonas sp. 4484_140]HHI87489.1 hypothetical protein [Candidatus Cloacimonadota bacterium]